MEAPTSAARASVLQLILVPAVITLGVSVLRLVGELLGWPRPWFNRGMGASIVGIAWLAPVFGIYFALRLAKSDQKPESFGRAAWYAILGVLVLVVLAFAPSLVGIEHSFYGRLLYGWTIFVVGALVAWRGWPALFKTLLVYGYAARVPVAIIMFFALRGNWGTHYDAVPPDFPAMSLMPKYLWLGFFPQLVLWVAYTILSGMLLGTIVASIARLVKLEREAPV
ncbi:MAG: hypothetical protein LAN62_18615 [Acidobacteriia bacterium]|nr:hypothetical protein [Terriglobia bacterium]